MLDPVQYEVISQALRALLLGAVPLLLLVSLAGLLVSGLLSAMSIHEPVAAYSARLIVFAVALYYFFPSMASALSALAELAFK